MKTIFKSLVRFFLLSVGILVVAFYMWIRFIRERLPKEIPFEMFYFTASIFMILCILYIFLIYFLINDILFTKYCSLISSNSILYNILRVYFKVKFKLFGITQKQIFILPLTYLSLFIHSLYKPVIELDIFIKEHYLIHPYYKKLILYIISVFPMINLEDGCTEENVVFYLNKYYKWLYFRMFLLPRIIMLGVFILDIFYFEYLYYTYKIIFLGLIILFSKYINYSLKYFLEKQLQFLDYAINVFVSDDWADCTGYDKGEREQLNIARNCLQSRRFIEEQANSMFFFGFYHEFNATVTLKYEAECESKYGNTYQTEEKLNITVKEEIFPVVYIVEQLKFHSEFFNKTKLILYLGYLICFGYLLAINLFTQFCFIYIIL